MSIRAELDRIVEATGRQPTARDVVDYATENRDSAIAKAMLWDDKEAGHAYRLVQAAGMIRRYKVTIIRDDRPPLRIRPLISLPSDRAEGGGTYRVITDVWRDADLRQEALAMAKAEAAAYRRKWQAFEELAPIMEGIAAVLDGERAEAV